MRLFFSVVTLLKQTEIDKNIADAIKSHFELKNDTDIKGWAVRSSAIGEDSDELSAAGQNETFLGCKNVEDINQSVRACWASLYKLQSVTYRW